MTNLTHLAFGGFRVKCSFIAESHNDLPPDARIVETGFRCSKTSNPEHTPPITIYHSPTRGYGIVRPA